MLLMLISLLIPVSFSNVVAILSMSLSSSALGCHAIDHEVRMSRILLLTVGFIFQETFDPLSR